MNLRVELILEEEKRSASVITFKSVTRIAVIVVPLILALVIAAFAYSMWQLNSNVTILEGKLATDKPRKEKSVELQSQLGANQQVLAELEGWQKSRLNVSEQILGVQQETPDKIQLSSLVLSQEIRFTNGAPARVFGMSLKGKAVGAAAQTHVVKLQSQLRNAPVFVNVMENTRVTDFRSVEGAPEANKNDRLFQINCAYKALLFSPPEAPRKTKKEKEEPKAEE